MAMMSPKSARGLYRPLAEINVTPLVDVMLVLLIIFMVTAPMLASGMKVNLPQAKQIQPLDQKAPVIVTVGKDKSLSLGPDIIEQDKLIDAIHEKLGSDTTQIIHLRGDKDAAYGDVVAIMDLLASNGLTHIAIVADPHTKADTSAKSEAQTKQDASTSPAVRTNDNAEGKARPAASDGTRMPAAPATPSASDPSHQ
ncbi:ExbD/TolR family protein [Methyloferula stellata]|uniref:ExbD/TolR family protein n=1 Tax=Methyloferula stellata TaxID=876270 RepID=UPI00037EDA23|nr:biopolymer transporter ExbD [Methyloferula stellata]